MSKKKKSGRPKNPTTLKLERQIKKLEEELDNRKQNSFSAENLEFKGMGFIYDETDKHFKLVNLKYDLETKIACVDSVDNLADSQHMAIFKIKKILTEIFHYNKLNKVNLKGESK
jgi:hypothetical protein